MALTLSDVLAPNFIRGLYGRVPAPGNPLSKFLGWQIDGKNEMPIDVPIESFTYDILDPDRSPAGMTLRARPATMASRKVIGVNTVAFARSYENDRISLEELVGTRDLGAPNAVITRQGEQYLEAMAKRMKQRQANTRELIAASLFNGGKYYLQIIGDNYLPSLSVPSGNYITVNLQLTAANINLYTSAFDNTTTYVLAPNGTNRITTAWSNSNATILTDCMLLNQDFEAIFGRGLSYVFCTSDVWNYVRNNTEVRNVAGAVQAPAEWTKVGNITTDDGRPGTLTMGVLKGIPWITWIIYDGGLVINNTFQTVLPKQSCTFATDMLTEKDFAAMATGTWVYKQYDHTPLQVVTGFGAYTAERANPAVIDFYAGQKVAPAVFMPNGLMSSRVY